MADLVGSLGDLLFKLFQMGSGKVKIPKDYFERIDKVKELLEDDYTGIVSTVFNYMVHAGTISFKFESSNDTLNNILNNQWQNNINSNVNVDIQRGLRAITTDYMRERWTSSLIALNIVWEKSGEFTLPQKMWISDGSQIKVERPKEQGKESSKFGKNIYYLGRKGSNGGKKLPLNGTDVLIRKPFESSYKKDPTPYLVKKGTLRHALIKKVILEKQIKGIEEIFPYLMILRAGDQFLAQHGKLGDIETKLNALKESLIESQNDRNTSLRKGTSIMKARYDVGVEHLIPELRKFFDEDITKGTDKNLFSSLGLIELQGFGDTRQEAILNPKVLIEEVVDAVLDLADLYKDVLFLIMEKNRIDHRNLTKREVRVIPGVIKATLTNAMLQMIQQYSDRGILSIEDTFQGLPVGFDKEVSTIRRQREKERGDEQTHFPRVILNQDNKTIEDIPNRTPSPQEVPQEENIENDQSNLISCSNCNFRFDITSLEECEKEFIECPKCHAKLDQIGTHHTPKERLKRKKKDNKIYGEYIDSPYRTNKDLPDSVKVLPSHAQTIWRNVFNSIEEETGDEERAIRGAWSQVKKLYKKDSDGKWIRKEDAILKTIDDLTNEIKSQLQIKEQIKLIKSFKE